MFSEFTHVSLHLEAKEVGESIPPVRTLCDLSCRKIGVLDLPHDGGGYNRKPQWPETRHPNRFPDDMPDRLLSCGWIDW